MIFSDAARIAPVAGMYWLFIWNVLVESMRMKKVPVDRGIRNPTYDTVCSRNMIR